MYRTNGNTEPISWKQAHLQGIRSRAMELERMLELGAYDTKIQQKEEEIVALRQKKDLLERELQRLRHTFGDLG